MSARRGTRKAARGKTSRNTGAMVIPHPPPIRDLSIIHETRLRFVCSAAFNGNITFQNLLDTMLMAATAVLGYNLFSAVKVKYVETWANSIVGSTTSVTVVFDGQTAGSIGDQRVHQDSSMGIEPAHVKAKPAPKTLASLFQVNSVANAFFLNVPVGTIIDVGLSFKQNLLGSAVAEQNALVGATVGAVYFRGLDGVAVAATKLNTVAITAV